MKDIFLDSAMENINYTTETMKDVLLESATDILPKKKKIKNK